MQKHRRKIIILLALLALGGIAYATNLNRVGDCLLQGGRWNWDTGFCRLDHPPL
jgi:hypothetical protein